MKIKYLIILLITFTLSSCKNEEDLIFQKIIGQWAIQEITYKDENVKDYLIVNFMTFDKEYFTIPEIGKHKAENEYDKPQWNLNIKASNKKIITLDCKNPIFKGRYELKFYKNSEKQLLSISLKSKNTYIIANKFFQNFDTDGKNWSMNKQA
ncbi:hypothetical protein [Aquimarina macrocephali]|uniref:hypothetical protein n=1 Tax=Aquimarina macrocephali TaxID=666563 RepID=UPI000463A462|nr:hypothetical protein [Aquimarina macrocephali]